MDYDDLERWMRETREYRSSTIRAGLSDVRRLLRLVARGQPLPATLRLAASRLAQYADDRGLALDHELQSAVDALTNEPPLRRGRRTRRKKPAQSLGDEEWRRLWAHVLADSAVQARVLEVMMATGLRIADVLRITRRALTHAMDSGTLLVEQKGGEERYVRIDGAPDAWGHLLQAWQGKPGATVALLVSPDGDGSTRAGDSAYKRVARRLRRLAKSAGISSRVHTHRLRRTVGVQALRMTEDVPAVQQLLGHRSFHTTMGYLDEARPDAVADLQRKLRDRYREEEP